MIKISKKKLILNIILMNFFIKKAYKNFWYFKNVNLTNKPINNFFMYFNKFCFIKIKNYLIFNLLLVDIKLFNNKFNLKNNSLIKYFYNISINQKNRKFKKLKYNHNYNYLIFFNKPIKKFKWLNSIFNTNIIHVFRNNNKNNIVNNIVKNFFKILDKDQIFRFLDDSSQAPIFELKRLNIKKLSFIIKTHNLKNFNLIFFFKKNFFFFYNILFINFILININKYKIFIKKSTTTFKFFLKHLNVVVDFLINNTINVNFYFVSNKYLINYLNFFEISGNNLINEFKYKNTNNNITFNNYYPAIFLKKKPYEVFFKNLKLNLNLNFLLLSNKILLNFLEILLQKNIYLKITSNRFNKINNFYLDSLLFEYKNFQPLYFKNFLFSDFLSILWYSFMLKDLKLLSQWVSKFMETLNFKNHKKFVNFLQNFLIKYSGLFIDVLKIKGFFFDIRGKVGVTGSSKKRHLCFKFGSINKSSKNLKINFNQNLVRTYSGVLGVTYIICF